MKTKLILILTVLLVAPVIRLKAQGGFEQLIKAGPGDATRLVEAYGNPLLKGFGLGMNSGWTNSAKTLGFLHFEIRVTGTAVIVPSRDKSFDVTKIGLSSNIGPANPNLVVSPTFSGNTDLDGPKMNIYDSGGNIITSFDLPRGVFEDFVPTPQIQATLGLIQNTDITIRAMPKIKINHDFGTVSLIGFGVKHNIIQDFADPDRPLPFDFALAFSFNSLKYNKSLNLKPDGSTVPVDDQQSTDFSGQSIYGRFDNYLFEAIISKKLSFFTPYIAAGYNTSKTKLGIKGNFPVPTKLTSEQIFYTTYSNPVKLNTTHVNGFRADIGFELKFPVLKIFGSYGMGERYSLINAGIGIGI